MPAFALLLLLLARSDSAALVSRARDAQAEFERARLYLLPPGSARSGEPCDARVGRFCYWSDGDGRLPAEPAAIGRARARLLGVLDSVSRELPGDAWVAGQRVRYLLEAGRDSAAVDAARGCRAASWWCAALEGLAWHEAGDVEAAERSYDAALRAMRDDERCRWTDLSDLLEEPLRRRYRRLSCGERQRFDARVWWLAQPLWSVPGNDRRTEHYARVTMALLLKDARSPYGLWGDDERELIVRYGWPLAWERDDGGGTRDPIAIGHEREPGYHFVPEAPLFDALTPGEEAEVLGLRSAREQYAPAYATTFTTLEPSFTSFRRGDSTLVVSCYDVSEDTLFRDSSLVAALVLSRDERSAPILERRAGAGPRGVLVARAAWEPALLSLELREADRRVAARSRAPAASLAPPPGAITLSGILLFEPDDDLPADLDAALARVHVGAVPRARPIGLYWEAYGLAPDEDVSTAVTVTPERTSWLRRVASALRLAPRVGGVRVEWRETQHPEQGHAPRALVLDLKGLGRGRYRIEVTVSPSAAAPATTTREVEVVER